MTEKEELQLLAKGSSSAFESLYNRYSSKLYNFMLKMTHGNRYITEELVQRTFVKIWEQRNKIDPDKSFLSFLCTIAKNLLLNEYEHETVKYVYTEYIKKSITEQQYDNTTEKEVDRKILESLIDKLIGELPPKRKEIFILSRKYGMSNKRIAEKMHISESTIETQLAKALIYMKNNLKHYINCILII
ncbi:RNA polymerase sigma-70 factor [Microbacter margulisiae]|uniref:RNA polymerase sigma factor n=1 Tax=Microbacter margulisiae TaxID=1350067 RepID=A0A7W5H0G8_9PORP|nr:RNA polymerase sigma-70 factor [Microbacter margulisiae]MBB3186543.1 RNA polymerase sigma-70 factor (ECF subfamily) [Microbacter margulisiae]